MADAGQAGSERSLVAGFSFFGAVDIFRPQPPIRWMVEGMRLAPGAPTLIAGHGYSGKSLILQSLALSLASGRPLWSKYPCRRGKVRYLDYEQGLRTTFDRFARMAYAMALDPSELEGRLDTCILPGIALTRDSILRLGDGADAVLIDSWRPSHPTIDENSSEVRRTLDVMGEASEATGCLYVTIHHSNKQGEGAEGIRGSTGFFDGCQTVWVLDGSTRGAPVAKLYKDRLYGSEMDPFTLRVTDTEGRKGLQLEHEAIPKDPPKGTPGRPRVPEEVIVAEIYTKLGLGPCTQRELCDRVPHQRNRVSARIQSMLAEGLIVRSPDGLLSAP